MENTTPTPPPTMSYLCQTLHFACEDPQARGGGALEQLSIGQREGVGPELLGKVWPHPVSALSLGGRTSERSTWHFKWWCKGVG